MKKLLVCTLLLLNLKTGISQNVFPSSGNVGIGTTSPQSTLDVRGDFQANGRGWFSYNSNMQGYSWTNAALTTNSIEIVNSNGEVNNSSPTLIFHRHGSGGPQFRLAADGSNVLYLESAGENSARNPNPYGGRQNLYFQRLHIDGSLSVQQNMGIGVSSPAEKLDIAGNIKAQRIKTGDAILYSNSRNSFNSFNTGKEERLSTGWIASDFGGNDNQSDRVVIGVGFNGKAIIGTHNYNLTDWGSELLLNPLGGNVAIGCTEAKEKLSVNGNIRSRKVIVTQTGWPDYVFEPTYQLPSLDSVHNFIKENKHLPEIPTAAAIEKDGHDLGEVQKLLLKKVEELTLYMIEQQKKIEQQQAVIESQNKRIEQLEKR